MRRSIRITIIALSVLFALAPASRALAQKKRIAVLDIEDAPNDLLRKDIVSILRGHTVISNDQYKRAAKRLRAETMTSENLSRVAASVKADGVLSGSVTESNGRYVLRLHLRSGRTGKTVQKLRLRLGRARLSKRMRGQLKKQLAVAIKQLRAVDDGRAPKDEDFGNEEEIEVVVGPKAKPGETKPGEAKPGDKSDTPDKTGDDSGDGDDDDDDDGNASAGSGQQDANPDSSGAGDASPVSTRVAAATDDKKNRDAPRVSKSNRGGSRIEPRRREARRAASLMLGASVVMRDLTFVLAEPFPEAPNGYDGPTAPGLNLRGELYPIQFTSLADSILSILGFAFRFDRVIGLQTAIDTGNQEILAQTTQSSYSVGVRLRYRFAGLPTQPTITVGAGLGKLSFILDDADLPIGVALDVPNTSYSYFDPGIWLRLAAHPRVHVEAGGQVLLINNAGDVQEPDQYGGASIKSYALDGSVEVLVTPNWRVRATGTYTSVALTFLGNGEQSYVRDGDPGDIDVLGANDRYLGGVLAVGYTY